jgi:hypothetical protein
LPASLRQGCKEQNHANTPKNHVQERFMSANEPLDFEKLAADLKTALTPEAAHKMERLIHTHVGGPMTTVYTQLQIVKLLLQRNPSQLETEIPSLIENMQFAAENIRTIVRALAVAAKPEAMETMYQAEEETKPKKPEHTASAHSGDSLVDSPLPGSETKPEDQ